MVAEPDSGAVLMHRPIPLDMARQVLELSYESRVAPAPLRG